MSKINNKNSTIKRVLLQIRPYLPTIILLLALAVVSVLCSLYIPVLVGEAIDAIIGKEQVNFAVIPNLCRRTMSFSSSYPADRRTTGIAGSRKYLREALRRWSGQRVNSPR